MSDPAASPESEQIADVAINDEETIIKRPPLQSEEGDSTGEAAGREPPAGE